MISLAELAELLDGELVGPADTAVATLGAVGEAAAGELVVAFDADAVAKVEAGPAAAVIVGAGQTSSLPHIKVADPRAAFDQLLDVFAPPPPPPSGIHPRATIDPAATIGADPTIGPGVAVEAGARVGDRCRIGANAVIGAGATLGDDVVIKANVTLYPNVLIGNRVILQSGVVVGATGFGYRQTARGHEKQPHLGTVVIEDDVEVGANTTIDRAKVGATRIGAGTKIDNLVMIAHNCQIGKACLIIAQVGMAGSVELGDGVVLAGQVGIVDHTIIGDGAVIGAQAGVMRDVPPQDRQIGSPAMNQVGFFKNVAAFRRLRDLVRRVVALEQAVGREDGDESE